MPSSYACNARPGTSTYVVLIWSPGIGTNMSGRRHGGGNTLAIRCRLLVLPWLALPALVIPLLVVRMETILPNGRAMIEASATLKSLNGSEFRADLKTSDRGRRDRLTALWRDRLHSAGSPCLRPCRSGGSAAAGRGHQPPTCRTHALRGDRAICRPVSARCVPR